MVLWFANVLKIYSDSVSQYSFSFPCLSNKLLLTCVTDDDIYEVKTIAYEDVFQCKINLNVFKGVVITYQEIIATFVFFIATVKRTR